jgi:hypothetical protein
MKDMIAKFLANFVGKIPQPQLEKIAEHLDQLLELEIAIRKIVIMTLNKSLDERNEALKKIERLENERKTNKGKAKANKS